MENKSFFDESLFRVGSKVVGVIGLLTFLFALVMFFRTVANDANTPIKGMITEIADLPGTDAQRITIEYNFGPRHHTKSDTTAEFRRFHHATGDAVDLLVNEDQETDVVPVEAIPYLRNSSIKTGMIGLALLFLPVLLNRFRGKQ